MFAWSVYGYYQMIHADDPRKPEVFVMEGMTTIIRGDIAIDLISWESYELIDDDVVETDSGWLAQVLWPDHSVTRLGPSTRIVIHEMIAEAGYEKIEISFSLKKWKIWTHVVRSMIGDSYFETRLPKNDIVAWVRGSTYEINLDGGYIHAVEHALSLKNNLRQKVLLMPGELVDSENILIRLGRELIDSTWTDINTAADTLYREARLEEISLRVSEHSNTIFSLIDRWIRSLLGNIQGFEILTLQDMLSQSGTISIASYSPEILTAYYQRIESIDARSDIEALRTALIDASKTSEKGLEKLLDTLKRWAFWELLDGKNILPSAQKLWENFAITPENIDTLLGTFEWQNLLDTLLSPSK
jgi:hypothetical protein